MRSNAPELLYNFYHKTKTSYVEGKKLFKVSRTRAFDGLLSKRANSQIGGDSDLIIGRTYKFGFQGLSPKTFCYNI